MRFVKKWEIEEEGRREQSKFMRTYFDDIFLIFQEATQALIEATTTPRHHHVQENDDDELDDEENNMNGEHSTDLRDNDDEINDPVCFDDFFSIPT